MENVILLLTDARGIYIPRDFAQDFDGWQGVSAEDREILSDPENEWYWETWDSVLSNAHYTDPTSGKVFHLHQDGDLVAQILGDVAPTRSLEGFMEHYAQVLEYTRHWSLATEIVEDYVHTLFRNVEGTWTVSMKDILEDGRLIFTAAIDANPLRALVKCLILHHQEINL